MAPSQMNTNPVIQIKQDQVIAAGLGHAIGDALGVPVEFLPRVELDRHPVRGMRGYGTHHMPRGVWSDDTSMTIALVQALLENRRFDYDSIMDSFVAWFHDGKFTVDGHAFDIGGTCSRAIHNYVNGAPALEAGPRTEHSNGNGSLMRIFPAAIICHRFNHDAKQQYELVQDLSGLTHRHPLSIMACTIHVNLLRHLLEGASLTEAHLQCKYDDYSMFDPAIRNQYRSILGTVNSIRECSRDNIRSTGFVKDTLEAVFWCLLTTYNYREAVLRAIDLGGDTDTIAALVGEVAALYYGLEAVPPEWLRELQALNYLRLICHRLADTTFKA